MHVELMKHHVKQEGIQAFLFQFHLKYQILILAFVLV